MKKWKKQHIHRHQWTEVGVKDMVTEFNRNFTRSKMK